MDQDIRALQEELRKLRHDLTIVDRKVEEQVKHQLVYPVDANSQSVYDNLFDVRLKSVLMDTLWKRVFRWYEPFDSLDNWDVSSDVLPGAIPFGGTLWIETAAVANDEQWAARLNLNRNTSNTFDRDSYMRIGVMFKGDDPETNSQYYMTVGDHLIDERNFYGFKVANGSLYGVISAAGKAGELMTKRLATIKNFDGPLEPLETYLLEARYYAGVKVDFFVTVNANGLPAKVASVPIASLRSPINIPAELTFDTPYIFSFSALTRSAETKVLSVFDLDYIQKLEVQ